MKKAMMKIRYSLTNNVGIKIIAVIIAALIWLTVVNISDPEKTIVIYNIPITITNENAITDMNMVYNSDKNASVSITVSGKRSVVSRLSADDFKATASLKELSKVNSVPIEVSAKQNSIGRNVTIEKQSMQTLEVSVEEVKKQKFAIEAEYVGSLSEGYVAGGYTLSKDNVTVEAPESVLDKIDKAVAQCDIEGETSDFTRKCSITLYDKHGNIVKSDNMSLSFKNVKVTVKILNEKEVPVVVNSISSPAAGYHIDNIELSPEKIVLVGTKERLNAIDSIVVDDKIDISDKTENTVEEIDISKYLPEGVYVGGDYSNTVSVNIKINKLVTKKFTINTKNIVTDGLGSNYEMSFISKNITVELQGENSVMKNISSDNIRTSINLNKYKEGTETVNVSVVVPDGTVLLNNVSVKVKITKKKR